jgi:hypothetical protein
LKFHRKRKVLKVRRWSDLSKHILNSALTWLII